MSRHSSALAEADYYPRFGFLPASKFTIKSQWEGIPDAFMILVLDSSAMRNVSGTAAFREEFNESFIKELPLYAFSNSIVSLYDYTK